MNIQGKDGMIRMETNMLSNDERILELKKQIEERKDGLKKNTKRFQPDTNCILNLDNVTYNLNVLTQDELIHLAIKLNSLRLSAEDMGYDALFTPIINGYSIIEWLHDVNNKIEYNNYNEEKKKLNLLEKQLTALLSSDKQTELKIDELAKMLGV